MPEDMDDTPVGSLGVVEHLINPIVRDGVARPFVFTRNTGTTHRMHTRALRLCSAFIPNADEITSCLRKKNAELSDACRTAFDALMTQLPGASDDARARNAPQDRDR